jgi:hypothetical protein
MHAPDRELKNAMNAGKKGQDLANQRSLRVINNIVEHSTKADHL